MEWVDRQHTKGDWKHIIVETSVSLFLQFVFSKDCWIQPENKRTFINLKALCCLCRLLNGNKLSGSLPNELGYLSSLDRFQIDENQISGSIPKSFSNLNSIKHMYAILDNWILQVSYLISVLICLYLISSVAISITTHSLVRYPVSFQTCQRLFTCELIYMLNFPSLSIILGFLQVSLPSTFFLSGF